MVENKNHDKAIRKPNQKKNLTYIYCQKKLLSLVYDIILLSYSSVIVLIFTFLWHWILNFLLNVAREFPSKAGSTKLQFNNRLGNIAVQSFLFLRINNLINPSMWGRRKTGFNKTIFRFVSTIDFRNVV